MIRDFTDNDAAKQPRDQPSRYGTDAMIKRCVLWNDCPRQPHDHPQLLWQNCRWRHQKDRKCHLLCDVIRMGDGIIWYVGLHKYVILVVLVEWCMSLSNLKPVTLLVGCLAMAIMSFPVTWRHFLSSTSDDVTSDQCIHTILSSWNRNKKRNRKWRHATAMWRQYRGPHLPHVPPKNASVLLMTNLKTVKSFIPGWSTYILSHQTSRTGNYLIFTQYDFS